LLRREKAPSEFFCNVCNKDLKYKERYEEHVKDDHFPCGEPGCNWSGPEFALVAHRLKHNKTGDGQSVVDSPEEIKAWIAGRRANFPSKDNIEKKAQLEEKRLTRGALVEDPKPKMGMIEKLLRKQSSVDSGGFGKSWGKGKKGKGKSKDKGKGQDKGKDKGKKGKKGKGKGKGKGGYWQPTTFDGDLWVGSLEGAPAPDHALVSVPMPSMLANCAPLEAPFGRVAQPPPMPRRLGSKDIFGLMCAANWSRV
jgi:hypothetical protein